MGRIGRLLGACGVGMAVVSGCSADPAGPDPFVDLATPETEGRETAEDRVTVAFGETVTVPDVGIEITYVALEGDSRCPVGLTCFWEGDAAVRVRGEGPDGSVEAVLHTTLEPGSMRVSGATVVLVDVLPRPVDGVDVDPADTRIVVTVER